MTEAGVGISELGKRGSSSSSLGDSGNGSDWSAPTASREDHALKAC